MLTKQDYESLKKSVKGWDARRLARYGISWPPQHGWRRNLVRQYEAAHRTPFSVRHRAQFPEEFELEMSLQKERQLTAYWYKRISGEIPWIPGEKDSLYEQMDAQAEVSNRLMREKASTEFASFPDC